MNSPSQEVTLLFQLSNVDDKDILIVDLSNCGKDPVTINLNNEATCQDEMKALFLSIVELMLDYDVSIEFIEDKEYPRKFISDAMSSFVADLSSEILTVKASMVSDLK